MASANDKIHTYTNTNVNCLGCKADMPYQTVDETVAGVTIQHPLRYCPACHAITLDELAKERDKVLLYAKAYTEGVSMIFNSIQNPRRK